VHHEQVRRAVALVFEIVDGRLAEACRQRRPGLPGQLLARLAHANQNGTIVEVAVVDLEHVLHREGEVHVLLRRNAPALLQPGLDAVFLKA